MMVIVKKGDERGSSVVIGEDADGEVLTDRAAHPAKRLRKP